MASSKAAAQVNPREMAALRKFVFTLAGYGPGESPPDGYDIGDAVDDAVARIDEIEELNDRVARIEAVVNASPENIAYQTLTRDRKVHIVRSKLVEIALNTNGSAALDYNEVTKLFDGHPSPGHAYDLMEWAADLEGFDYDKNPDGNDRVIVRTDAVNDLAMFRTANKEGVEEAG